MNQSNKNFHIALIAISLLTVVLLYFTRSTSIISITTGACAGLSIRLFVLHKKESFAGTKELDWLLLLLFSAASLICYFMGLYVVQGPLLIFVGIRSLIMFFKMYGEKPSSAQTMPKSPTQSPEISATELSSAFPPEIPHLRTNAESVSTLPPDLPSNSQTDNPVSAPIHDIAGVKGWSWGAFFLSWIWAIGNRTWIGLLALIPYVNIVVMIWLGVKGREMAWKNRAWRDLDHFNSVQKKWSQWGIGLACASFVLGIVAAIGAPAYKQYKAKEAEAQLQSILEDATPKASSSPTVEVNSGQNTIAEGNVYYANGLLPSIATSIGTFAASTPGMDQASITLNNKAIFQSEGAQWHEIVRGFKLAGGKEVILMRTSGGMGTSCEALFFFLTIEKANLNFTPYFGTCSTDATFKQSENLIEIVIPKMGGSSTITFDGSVVREDGVQLALNDTNDPSK